MGEKHLNIPKQNLTCPKCNPGEAWPHSGETSINFVCNSYENPAAHFHFQYLSHCMTKPTKWFVCPAVCMTKHWVLSHPLSAQWRHYARLVRALHNGECHMYMSIARSSIWYQTWLYLEADPFWGAGSRSRWANPYRSLNVLIMHKSFVTMCTTPMGPGNSEDFDISLYKARIYAWHWGGHFYCQSLAKSPAQIPAGKCEITLVGLGMDSKAILSEPKTWHLSPAIP